MTEQWYKSWLLWDSIHNSAVCRLSAYSDDVYTCTCATEVLWHRELGVSAEDVMRQQLENYPPDQQRQLASGARDFVDHFRWV